MPEDSLLQIGALGIILVFAIKEFFAYLKSKKELSGNGMTQAILRELQTMNSNHLTSLKEVIEKGNERLIDAIHSDNSRMIELLGEIKGRLNG